MTADDPIDKLRRDSPERIEDTPGERMYFVRVNVPAAKRIIATAVTITESHIDSEEITALREREGVTRDQAFEFAAIDSVRMKLEQAGFTREQLTESSLVECRRTDAAEVKRLQTAYARRDGN